MNQLDDNLWIVDRAFKFLAADMGNRMTVIRLKNDLLFLHSPVEYSESLGHELQQLGEVRYLISPNRFHDLFIDKWQQAFPKAIHYSLHKKFGLHRKLDEIAVVEDIADDILALPVQGMPKVEEYVFYHRPSRCLILTDLAFNISRDISAWSKLFFSLNGALNRFGPSRLMRSMIKDPIKFRYSLQHIMQWDFQRIILSHGNIVESDAKKVFANGFSQYLTTTEKSASVE